MNTNHVTDLGCTSVQSVKSTQGIIIESIQIGFAYSVHLMI